MKMNGRRGLPLSLRPEWGGRADLEKRAGGHASAAFLRGGVRRPPSCVAALINAYSGVPLFIPTAMGAVRDSSGEAAFYRRGNIAL